MSEHVHLADDELDQAAESRLIGAALPSCLDCAAAVNELARHIMTARAVAGQRTDPAGSPAVSAVRELRRSTYAKRALQQITGFFVRPAHEAQS